MKIWINAQLSPAIAHWIAQTFDVEAIAVRDLGLRDATDREIFDAAIVSISAMPRARRAPRCASSPNR